MIHQLATGPKLLADEPTTALDVTVRSYSGVLGELQQKPVWQFLMITHDPESVRQFADRVCHGTRRIPLKLDCRGICSAAAHNTRNLWTTDRCGTCWKQFRKIRKGHAR
jgi:ABC-type microcin C transport system duplicated ATPase subunit YejF